MKNPVARLGALLLVVALSFGSVVGSASADDGTRSASTVTVDGKTYTVEQINTWVGQFLREHRRTLDGLTLTDVLALLGALDARGAFAIRSAPRYVAEVLGVSRATLYSRLKQARQSNKPAVPGP